MAERFLEINLIARKIKRDWKPVDRVNHEEFVSLAFALVDYVNRTADKSSVLATFSHDKFPHWDSVVRFPVKVLTGHDAMEISATRSATADLEDMFEILSVLDSVWNYTDEHERQSMTINDIQQHIIDTQQEMLTDKFRMKANKFGHAFGKYARERNALHGGHVGEYLVECIADRKTDGVNNKKYRITKPAESIVHIDSSLFDDEEASEAKTLSFEDAKRRFSEMKTRKKERENRLKNVSGSLF